MASKTAKRNSKLREFLEEQQEPFVLEAYLLERGCYRKIQGSSGNSSENRMPEMSGESDQKKDKKGISQSSKVLRAVYNKVLAFNNLLRISGGVGQSGKLELSQNFRNSQELSESEEATMSFDRNCVSFASESSHSLKLVDKRENAEAGMHRNLHQECTEEGKQFSPVSVLEDIFSDSATQETRQEKCSSRNHFANRTKITDEKILSASLLRLLSSSRTENPSCSSDIQDPEETFRSVSSTILKSKRLLQQKKQLLFDFVKEAVEKNQIENLGIGILGFEEIGNFITEKTRVLGDRQSGDEMFNPKLSDSDLFHSAHEFRSFVSIKKKIASEISDLILEDAKNEIVLQLSFETTAS